MSTKVSFLLILVCIVQIVNSSPIPSCLFRPFIGPGGHGPFAPSCLPCRSVQSCICGHSCFANFCTDGSYRSLLGCGLKAECAHCSSSLQCATKRCHRGKCVFNTQASINKCHRIAECGACTNGAQCEQGVCFGSPGRCTDGSVLSLQRCGLKPRCARCTASRQCSTRWCRYGRCHTAHPRSFELCSVLPTSPPPTTRPPTTRPPTTRPTWPSTIRRPHPHLHDPSCRGRGCSIP